MLSLKPLENLQKKFNSDFYTNGNRNSRRAPKIWWILLQIQDSLRSRVSSIQSLQRLKRKVPRTMKIFQATTYVWLDQYEGISLWQGPREESQSKKEQKERGDWYLGKMTSVYYLSLPLRGNSPSSYEVLLGKMPLRGGIILLFIYYFVLRWKLLRQKKFMRMIFHTLVIGDMTYLNEGI